MKHSDSALLAKKWQHQVSFGFECWPDVYVSEAFALVGHFRAANPTLVIIFIHCVEVDWLLQKHSRDGLLINVFRFESFFNRRTATNGSLIVDIVVILGLLESVLAFTSDHKLLVTCRLRHQLKLILVFDSIVIFSFIFIARLQLLRLVVAFVFENWQRV